MKIPLKYGKGETRIELPDSADVTGHSQTRHADLSGSRGAVAAALDQPVASPRLEQLAKGASTACIAICDITRPVPNHLFLRPIIERLLACRRPARRNHRAGRDGTASAVRSGTNFAELIGDPWVLNQVRVSITLPEMIRTTSSWA